MSDDLDNFLAHYGVLGMKWGVRKGPGAAVRAARKIKRSKISAANDKHYDDIMSAGNKYDSDRSDIKKAYKAKISAAKAKQIEAYKSARSGYIASLKSTIKNDLKVPVDLVKSRITMEKAEKQKYAKNKVAKDAHKERIKELEAKYQKAEAKLKADYKSGKIKDAEALRIEEKNIDDYISGLKASREQKKQDFKANNDEFVSTIKAERKASLQTVAKLVTGRVDNVKAGLAKDSAVRSADKKFAEVRKQANSEKKSAIDAAFNKAVKAEDVAFAKYQRDTKKANADFSAVKKQAKIDRAVQKAEKATPPAKKLTDRELQERVSRMNLEKQYNKLSKPGLSTGQKVAAAIMVGSATTVGTTYVSKYMSAGVEKVIKKVSK